jgi:hypothetical protein
VDAARRFAFAGDRDGRRLVEAFGDDEMMRRFGYGHASP